MTEKTVKPELLIMVDRLARIGRAMQRARAVALRKAQHPDGQEDGKLRFEPKKHNLYGEGSHPAL